MLDFTSKNDSEFTLENIYTDCWERIALGAKSAKHPFHLVTLSTINNGFPEIRTVVLRKVNPIESTLNFHTDYRSPKVNQIKENPSVAILLYDFESRLQIRLRAKATIHHLDFICEEAWGKSRLESRRCYLVDPSPSSIINLPDDGLPKNLSVKDLTEENVKPGFQNFVVIKTKILELDWLFLNHEGHRRAQFKINTNDLNHVEKNWMLP
jgi:3-hydroxyisobutyrate dehydrogenase